MANIRFQKVRRTDYSTGRNTPPEKDGLDHLAAANRREQAEHDRALAGYGEPTLRAMAADLGKRRAWDRNDHEQRWIMHRLAAAGRRLATA